MSCLHEVGRRVADVFFLISRPGEGVTKWLRPESRQGVALAVVLTTMFAAVAVLISPTSAQVPNGSRGPGLRRPAAASPQLPVPRTFDLAHVTPAHFAGGLGHDPGRLFEFVRDQIAYESYSGVLRGARGTLLALAGNSADRAALLGALLEHSGQRIRYVRGTLSESHAKELGLSIWAARSQRVYSKADGEESPAHKAATQALVEGVRRDYTTIRDQLKKAGKTFPSGPIDGLGSLVKEAQAHYWVQWWRGGAWADLDPSFSDAKIGQSYAKPDRIFESLPEELFHRITIRVNLEEYTEGKASSRPILTFQSKAADLSGIDVILTHEHENWKGPAAAIAGALSAAIENTGRVKPIFIIGDQIVTGEPFHKRPPSGRGIGGVGSLLSGQGVRRPIPLATAEWVEFDFIYPDGRKETVVRELFDRVGKARRAEGKILSPEEVKRRTEANDAFDVMQAIYAFFFTTGRMDIGHYSNLVEAEPEKKERPLDVRAFLQRLIITFTVATDALSQVGEAQAGLILFYPDSPRVYIAEFSTMGGIPARVVLDLRRDHARAVASGSRPEALFLARVFRGVLNGTLERVTMEYIATHLREKAGPVMSTSGLFGRARADGVPIMLLASDKAGLSAQVPEDVRARILGDLSVGRLVIAPQRSVSFGHARRYAWWRIDPHSGETIAVTDDGLHAATTQAWAQPAAPEGHMVVTTQSQKHVHVIRARWIGSRWVPYAEETFFVNRGSFVLGVQYLAYRLAQLLASGSQLIRGLGDPPQ